MKKEINILAFLCNWAPWSCYIDIGENGIPIPDNIKVIRIMCAGRVNISHVLKSFERGADGIIIVGCQGNSCQNGIGPEMARKNIAHARQVLHILGLTEKRLAFKEYLPQEAEKLSADLYDFVEQVEKLGKSPVSGFQTHRSGS